VLLHTHRNGKTIALDPSPIDLQLYRFDSKKKKIAQLNMEEFCFFIWNEENRLFLVFKLFPHYAFRVGGVSNEKKNN